MSLLLEILFVYLSVVFSTPAEPLNKNLFTATSKSPTEVHVQVLNEDLKQHILKLQEYIHLGEYDTNFIETLNEFKTMNNNQIVFSPEEINLLTNENDDEVSLVSKQLAQLKYFRKIQDIQCTSNVILNYMLTHLKYSVDRLLVKNSGGSSFDSVNINTIKEFVYYNMISILFDAKYVVPIWLWDVYIKLMALSNWSYTIELLKEEMFDFEKLKTIIGQLIEQCVKNDYLPKDYISYYNLTKADEDYDYLLNEIAETYTVKKDIGCDDNIGDYFGVKQLYLQSLWNDEDTIFIDIFGVKINWVVTKEIYYKEKDNAKSHFENGGWITHPFECIQFQNMFLDITKVNLLCFIWVHIYLYQKQVNEDKAGLWQCNNFLKKILLDSLKSIDYEDETLDKCVNTLFDLHKFTSIELNQIIREIEIEVNTTISKLNGLDHQPEYRWAYIDYDETVIHFETSILCANVCENEVNEPYKENYTNIIESIEWETDANVSDENEHESEPDVNEPNEEEKWSSTDVDEMTSPTNTETAGELLSETDDATTEKPKSTEDVLLPIIIDDGSVNCSTSAVNQFVYRFLVTNTRNMFSYVNFLNNKLSPTCISDLIYFVSGNKNTDDIFIPNN